MNLFEESIEKIKIEAKTNPNKSGWRFLLTSKKTLEKNNGILLITLNPGGDANRPDHPSDSCENGCAYLEEPWKGKPKGTSPLQKQIQCLFREIANRLDKDCKEVLEASVCGYFIPFRSPAFDALAEKDRCIDFSKDLWRNILSKLKFRVIFCIDRETYKNIREIFISMQYSEAQPSEEPTGWGNYRASITHFEKGNQKVTLVRFPHLSRFSIFDRKESKEAICKIMDNALQNYK